MKGHENFLKAVGKASVVDEHDLSARPEYL